MSATWLCFVFWVYFCFFGGVLFGRTFVFFFFDSLFGDLVDVMIVLFV